MYDTYMYIDYVLLDWEMYLEMHNEKSGSFLFEVCEWVKFKENECLLEVTTLLRTKSTC